MACFFCITTNSRQCGSSCGLCGTDCPGYVPEPLTVSMHDGYQP